MTDVRTSRNGISYLSKVLLAKQRVVTKAIFWRIPHASGPDEVNLKIGRYQRANSRDEVLETEKPKSEFTLVDSEFRSLVDFISVNYEPIKSGARRYITIDDSLTSENVAQIKALFRSPNKQDLLEFLIKNDVVPQQLLRDIEYQKRVEAIAEYEHMLANDCVEADWQRWFTNNCWVLGSEFVRILDERAIDTDNIADYLVEAYDGFLDIIEIKRPGGAIAFWSATLDHNNYVPSQALVRAITQATSYVHAVETEINSVKFLERVGGILTVKPRCVLVFGRSKDWNADQKRSFRILNANYHSLSIMTYDHVLARAKQLLSLPEAVAPEPSWAIDDEIPF